MEVVTNLLKSALYECCPPEHCLTLIDSPGVRAASRLAYGDLVALAEKDPSANRDLHVVATGYSSYSAVLHYRLAHSLLTEESPLSPRLLNCYASLISQRGKLKSGAEIHHRARIGERFVLDHGYGTVIGETCRIGSDCYFLGGVVLGARGISENPPGDRHPVVGHHVQIGAFSSVLGSVSIGNHVFIGPGCTVINDLPDGCKVINRDFENQKVLFRHSAPEYEQAWQVADNKL